MNDPDNFLSRWSRRKLEVGEGKEKKEESAAEAHAKLAPDPGKVTLAPDKAAGPEFDADSLPPIESISAESDITAFMRIGVPETLKHAALRRAWSSDPVIRDFVGLNENYWDAAGPDGIAGFGDLDPNIDIKRMVSELFGETPRQDAPSDSKADRTVDSSVSSIPNEPEAANLAKAETAAGVSMVQRNENAAVQTEMETAEQSGLKKPAAEKKFARRHGGAMPQ
jgi:hypothetical protein